MEWIVFVLLAVNFFLTIRNLMPKRETRLRPWQQGGELNHEVMDAFRAQIRRTIRQRQSSEFVEKVDWKKEGF